MTTSVTEPGTRAGVRAPRDAAGSAPRVAAEAAAVGALALAVRLPGLAHEPWGDELYHILSARQYLETGVLGINGGLYQRDAAYSYMVAALYRVFGDGAVIARLPALAAGILTILVLFLWIRRGGDRLAAWIAAIVAIFTPTLIEQAQYARAYPLHHLFVLLAAVALSALLAVPRPPAVRAFSIGIGGVLALFVAMYFQQLTLIAAAGLAIGAALLAGPRLVARVSRRRLLIAAAGVAALIVAGVMVAQTTGVIDRMLRMATYSDMWAERNRGEFRFYHWMMLANFPTAWTLFPVIVLLALLRAPRLAVLATSVFVVAFVTHSTIAWKAARYFSYALPFFALLVGLGVAEAVPIVRQALRRLLPGRPLAVLRWVAALGLVLFLVVTNHAFVRSGRLMLRDPQFLYPGGQTPTLSWSLAQPALAPVIAESDVVVSTEDLEALYFFDRLDYVLDRDHLRQGAPKPEFTVDGRIEAQMIGEESSLRRVVACHESGVLIAMRWALSSYKMAPETSEFIRRELEEVPLPRKSGLVAYRWHGRVPAAARRCEGLPISSRER